MAGHSGSRAFATGYAAQNMQQGSAKNRSPRKREKPYEHGSGDQQPTVPQMQSLGRPMDRTLHIANLRLVRSTAHPLQGKPQAQAVSHHPGGRVGAHRRVTCNGYGDPDSSRNPGRHTRGSVHGGSGTGRLRRCRCHSGRLRDARKEPAQRSDCWSTENKAMAELCATCFRTDLHCARIGRVRRLGKRHHRDLVAGPIEISRSDSYDIYAITSGQATL